jgi:4-cresol dehydrogenase (hydroxylating)
MCMDIFVELSKRIKKGDDLEILSPSDASLQYGKTTYSTPIELDSAIIVKHQSTIAKVLTLANELKFNIYPISTNKNWGYGSFNPKSGRPNVVIDLGRLCTITPTSKELGLITIEPGVTQQQLYEYLLHHDWPYMVPVTGAGPTCSLVSNAIERGYGITPHNDHFYSCTALKGYIPHPELCNERFESAISALDKSGHDFIDKTYKWGLGPYLEGLFTQSNLGIVSEMTLRLAPKPQYFCAFYIQIFNEQHFEEAVLLVQDMLKNYAGIVGSINLMDLRRLISITAENPNGYNSSIVMSSAQVNTIRKNQNLPQWMVVGSIYGSRNIVKAAKKYIKQKAHQLGKIYFSDSLTIKTATAASRYGLLNFAIFDKIKRQLDSLQEGIDIMLGIPNQVALPLPYWRNTKVRPNKASTMSPSQDECGLLWYAPLLKMNPDSLQAFISFVRETTPKYNIEPFITFTNLKHDCVDSTVPLVFNLKDEAEVENAHDCLNELINEGAKLGFVPYRLDTKQQMKLDANHIFWKTTDKIKQALDPNKILAPDRYNPS